MRIKFIKLFPSLNKCNCRSDGSIVALKEIKIHNQEGLPFTAIREGQIKCYQSFRRKFYLHNFFACNSKINQAAMTFEL